MISLMKRHVMQVNYVSAIKIQVIILETVLLGW